MAKEISTHMAAVPELFNDIQSSVVVGLIRFQRSLECTGGIEVIGRVGLTSRDQLRRVPDPVDGRATGSKGSSGAATEDASKREARDGGGGGEGHGGLVV